MRSFHRTRSLLFVLLVLAVFAYGDVPPDPGYTSVSADLTLETASDLSAYRFFLESPMSVEEVKLIAGSPTVIPAAGRGGAARRANLIAVPVADMSVISGDISGGTLEDFIRSKRFPNARELFSHDFQTTISIFEKPIWKAPTYQLSLESGVVTVAKAKGGTSGSLLVYVMPVVAVSVLIAVGIAIIGLWLFRRSRKKV